MLSQQPDKRRALTRLNLVGKATALLAGGLGLVYLLGEAWTWLTWRTDIIQAILHSYAETLPQVVAPGFTLSTPALWLLALFDILPGVMTALVLLLTGLFFLRLSRNELWSRRNVRLLWSAGLIKIVTPIVIALCATGQGLALSLDLPAGERLFQLSAGLSTDSIYEVVTGIVLCAFAWIIGESTKLHEENALYI